MILRSRKIAQGARSTIRSYASQHQARSVFDAEALAKLQRQEQALNARSQRPLPRGSDKLFYLTAMGLLLATPPIVYFWWQHRAEHMGKKKQDMLQQLEIKRKEFLEKQR